MALIVAPTEVINHRFRRGGSGKKDSLDLDADRANKLNLSYGKFKALEREGRLPAGAPATLEEAEEIEAPAPAPAPARDPCPVAGKRKSPEPGTPRPCAVCGEMFAPAAPNGRYCGPACSRAAALKRQADKRQRIRAEARA